MTPAGELPRCVGVRGGTIAAIEPSRPRCRARTVDLADDEVLLPGMVDTHVHVNDPGRTEWEGFASATRAAAAGGVTTIIDMPLNSLPPTVHVAALEVKRAVAAETRLRRRRFLGRRDSGQPATSCARCTTRGCSASSASCRLRGRGVPAPGPRRAAGGPARAARVRRADDRARRGRGGDRACAVRARRRPTAGFLHSRPRGVENLAIAHVIEPARWTGAPGAHPAPVELRCASDDRAARAATASGSPSRPARTTWFSQPRRSRTGRRSSSAARRSGRRQPRAAVAGARRRHDRLHRLRPFPVHPRLKRLDVGDFDLAWGGIASLQLGAARRLDRGAPARLRLADVIRWMAERPAALAGLTRKGRIAVGATPTSRVRTRRGLRGRRHPAAAPQCDHPLRGTIARRRRPQHLAARSGADGRRVPRSVDRQAAPRRARAAGRPATDRALLRTRHRRSRWRLRARKVIVSQKYFAPTGGLPRRPS